MWVYESATAWQGSERAFERYGHDRGLTPASEQAKAGHHLV
jgi:hypothetical protein